MADNWWDDLLSREAQIGPVTIGPSTVGLDFGGLIPGPRPAAAVTPRPSVEPAYAAAIENRDLLQYGPEGSGSRGVVSSVLQGSGASAQDDSARKIMESQIRQENANAALAEARVREIDAKITAENDPRQKQLLDIQLTNAQATLAKTLADIERMKQEMPQREQILLTDQLAREREHIRQEFESRKSDADFEKQMALEGIRFGQQLELDERRGQRDILRDSMTLGVQTRGQELQRLKAQDDMVINMLQNQIAAGKLSLDKAAKQFEAYSTNARLPSEILRNVAAAAEPFLPYMTTAKTGDIPLGFEKGGSMDVLGRLGGNKPGSYTPEKYAVKTSPMPFDIAKSMKAPKMPDPKKLFGGVPDITVNPNQTSATAQLPGVMDFVGQTQQQQASIGLGGGPLASPSSPPAAQPNLVQNAMPSPPPQGGGGLTDEERQQLLAALG